MNRLFGLLFLGFIGCQDADAGTAPDGGRAWPADASRPAASYQVPYCDIHRQIPALPNGTCPPNLDRDRNSRPALAVLESVRPSSRRAL